MPESPRLNWFPLSSLVKKTQPILIHLVLRGKERSKNHPVTCLLSSRNELDPSHVLLTRFHKWRTDDLTSSSSPSRPSPGL